MISSTPMISSTLGWLKITPAQIQALGGFPPVTIRRDTVGNVCVNLDEIAAQLPVIDPYFLLFLLVASPFATATEPTWA